MVRYLNPKYLKKVISHPTIQKLTLFALILVVAIFGAFSYIKQLKKPHNTISRTGSETSLKVLFVEHATLVLEINKSIANGQTDDGPAKISLESNIISLVKSFGEIYGEEEVRPVFDLLKKQNDALFRYTSFMRNGYVDNAANELPEITAFPDTFASAITKLNSQTSKTDLKNKLVEYVANLKTFVDSYVARDFVSAYSKGRDIVTQIDGISTLLINDAIKVYPERFQD